MHSSTDGHMGYFHILVVINNAAMNTGVFIFFQISVFGFIRYIPKSGITGSKGKSTFNFLRLCPYYFPQWLQQSAFPPTVQKCSLFSTPSPALVVCWFIDDSHSDRCEEISQGGFNMHFSDDWWCWASFPMSIGHLYVLFGEVSVQVLCPFLNLIIFFGVEVYKFFINCGFIPL